MSAERRDVRIIFILKGKILVHLTRETPFVNNKLRAPFFSLYLFFKKFQQKIHCCFSTCFLQLS